MPEIGRLYRELEAERDELRAANERLREALEHIATYDGSDWEDLDVMRDIARKALGRT